MSDVFRSTAATVLRANLDTILDDDLDGAKSMVQYKEWMDTSIRMNGAYMDDQEFAGPAYGSERDEGMEIQAGVLTEGQAYRWITRGYGLKMSVTEEMEDDNKYPEVLNLALRCKRAMYKTMDLDATSVLVYAESTARTYGDGLALASASHTIPAGGTFSNTMATPLSPGVAAVVAARTQVMKYPDYDGTQGMGFDIEKVVYPVEQWAVWSSLLSSKIVPDAGNFSETNVVNSDMSLKTVCLRQWTNTTSNYCFITNAEGGPGFRVRKDLKARSWVDHDKLVMRFAVTGRWSRGTSNARGILFVGA